MKRHPIPDAALGHHIAILGKTGSGKTFTAKGIVELLLARSERVVVVDPTGVWWGLRLAADGARASRYKIAIFGGRHADLPIGTDGEVLARILGGSATSAILDVQQLGVGERTRLFTAFAEALLRENRGPLHLVLDEAHLFAPQGGGAGGFEQAQLLHATNNLVALGRSAGLRITLISQRPAKLHKDSLTQVETLVAMRVISPQDRKAVADWLAGAPDTSGAGEILNSLSSLPVGTGWVYAPEQGVLERVAFPAIDTFDSSRAAGSADAPDLKPLDVSALRAAISSSTSDEVEKINTPSGRSTAKADAAVIEAAERRGYERGLKEGYGSGREDARRDAATALSGLAETLRAGLADEQPEGESQSVVKVPTRHKSPTSRDPLRDEHRETGSGNNQTRGGAAGALNSAAHKLLAVLDTNPPVRRSWQQTATLAGLRARGGHFNAGRKGLLDAGLVVEEGGLVAIAAPSAHAPPALNDPAALLETWAAHLSGAAPRLLRALFEVGGECPRRTIASRLDIQPRGGHWNAGWKELRDNGLVTVDRLDFAQLTELFRP